MKCNILLMYSCPQVSTSMEHLIMYICNICCSRLEFCFCKSK